MKSFCLWKKLPAVFALAGFVFWGAAADVVLQDDGVGTFGGGGRITARHFDEKWRAAGLGGKEFRPETAKTDGLVRCAGSWNVADGRFSPRLTVEAGTLPGGGKEFRYRVESEAEIPTNSLAAEFHFPVETFAGRAVRVDHVNKVFPQESSKGTYYQHNETSNIRVFGPDRVLEIAFDAPRRIRIVDNRQFGNLQLYTVRIDFPGEATSFRGKAELSFRVRELPLPQTGALNLVPAANMGFADEVDNDGRGGWTDQGPDNDLRSLPVGKLSVPPVEFLIADPAANGGKSAIVLGGGGRPNLPRRAELPMDGKRIRSLFLLHAFGWANGGNPDVGHIVARYADGSEQRLPVRIGRDLNNWWAPLSVPNGAVAWRGKNPANDIGLYLSAFELNGKPLKSLGFESTGSAIWGIAALSAAEEFLPLPEPRNEEFVQSASADWRVLKNERDVVAGSALDFSFVLDAPAGKYGFLRVTDDGHFRFEHRREPVRFYGTNLCFWAHFISREQADTLAERLGRIGYNAVRFHHFDRDLVKRGTTEPVTLRPDRLDQLDYLVYALKQRGLYITFDLYTARVADKGTFRSFPDELGARDYKLAAMLLPEVNADLKRFAGQLLTHVNPYTKLRWADDPVFVGLSLLNENTVYHISNYGSGDAIRKLCNEKFEEWCRAESVTVTAENRDAEFRRFLSSVYDRYYADMVQFLRKLGVKMPLTEQNFIMSPNLTRQRAAYDYVDNHLYWDHPSFLGKQWSLPVRYHNRSVIEKRLNAPGDLAPTRVFGKPFTVTEFNFCRPNPFRAEGAPIFGAFAAQQDWDAVYRFAYSHNNRTPFGEDTLGSGFDSVNDPVQLLSERLAVAFFIRRDVKVAAEAFPVAVSPLEYVNYQSRYPASVQELMFFGRVGSVLCSADGKPPVLPAGSRALFALDPALKYDGTLPVLREPGAKQLIAELLKKQLIPASSASGDGEKIRTPNGEFRADFKAGTFAAATPESEVLIAPEGNALTGERLSVETVTGFAVTGAVALDGKSLADAGRILLLHLSDVTQGGAKYRNASREIILDNGSGPILARRAVSRIALKTDGKWKLYALNIVGRRLAEVPFRMENGKLTFTADTFGGAEIIFAYELVRL